MKRTRKTYGSTNDENDGPTAIAAIVIIIKQWMRQYDDNTKNDNDQNDTLLLSIAKPLQ